MVRYDKKDRSLAGRGKVSVSSKVVPKHIPGGTVVKRAADQSAFGVDHCLSRSLRHYFCSLVQEGTQYRIEDEDDELDDKEYDSCDVYDNECKDDESDNESDCDYKCKSLLLSFVLVITCCLVFHDNFFALTP